MTLVLASNSPRRKHLLGLGGWTFTVLPAEVDESPLPGEAASVYVLRLAQDKARYVASMSSPEATVIASDTTVVDNGDILGKPASSRQAEVMLRRLRGHRHQVYTGLAALRVVDGTLLTDCCVTDVPMRNYSDEEMLAYIASGDPLDKAGAYAIQHPGFKPVTSLNGCYANVVGLPLCHLMRTLDKLDVHPDANIPVACQASLQYSCPIYHRILAGEV
jgi:nucleoside triphosphate pyrophosphatase